MALPGSPQLKDSTSKCWCFYGVFPLATLFLMVFLMGSTVLTADFKARISRFSSKDALASSTSAFCKGHCESSGSEALPKGIINRRSNLEMRPLWDSNSKKIKAASKSLLAIAAGIKQKQIVDKIVQKFLSSDFTIMIFHYDGVVDEWRDLFWCDNAIHVSAVNQTKWWFAKRFLHPDIVNEYSYIFLWDEDLEVNNFHPERYLSIIKQEGLEISQPALDPVTSEVHHPITARRRKTKVHRRMYKFKGSSRCYKNSTSPPCTGWVEMMAPVFSRPAWRCSWHMIQNDLIHAWGMDMKLGYCAQGDRTRNIGVVDAEYVVHKGIPSLGGLYEKQAIAEPPASSLRSKNSTRKSVPAGSSSIDERSQVRIRSSEEFNIFRQRWRTAVADDECWTDPFPAEAGMKTR